jgi:competence protein ComEA
MDLAGKRDRWMRRVDQVSIAILTSAGLLLLLSHWCYRGALSGRYLEFDAATDDQLPKFMVSVNQADWPELMLLPGIGETMARRIVDWRDRQGPFRAVADLEQVPGIGSRTAQRIAAQISFEITPAVREADESR